MKRFCQLFHAIDATASTNEKVAAIQAYFQAGISPADQAWALYLLLGKTRRRLVTSRVLREVFLQISPLPEWLFEDCYAQVGDTAEVIALLLRDAPLPPPDPALPLGDLPLHQWMEQVIPPIKQAEDAPQRAALITTWWAALGQEEVFVLNKILTGAFRIGVSEKLVIRGLAAATHLPEAVLAHRLMGDYAPTVAHFQQIISPTDGEQSPSQPYPFFLAAPLDEAKFAQEPPAHWLAEWKWDGIRAQAIRRADQSFIWSRGEDLVTPQFPELAKALAHLPNGTVLDGEILCWAEGRPLSFNHLQKRLGRKRVGKTLLAEHPVHFIAYDLLETEGQDQRDTPLETRQQRLHALLTAHPHPHIHPSEVLLVESFAALKTLRQQARQRGAEGLMVKRRDSPYLVGRKRGHWWKYKVEPMTLDAVLIYAQAGSGKRANLFTDYTFALWRGEELVPFAKAYSGLDNQEIETLDRWIRRHTVERFGPVRSVEPIQVFEIGFEGIAPSSRHKSGISVRFPRILRWRTDKPAAEADTLTQAMALLEGLG